jgi:hypothetical protein
VGKTGSSIGALAPFLTSQLGGQIQNRVNFGASQKIILLVKVDLFKRNISLQDLLFQIILFDKNESSFIRYQYLSISRKA